VGDPADRGEGLRRSAFRIGVTWRVVDEAVAGAHPPEPGTLAVADLGDALLDAAQDVVAGDDAEPVRLAGHQRRAAKKSRRRVADSAARMPKTPSGRWFRAGSARTSRTEPAAPALGSGAAKTTVGMRARTIAPAHIAQGSRVTQRVVPGRRQPPIASAAARIARI